MTELRVSVAKLGKVRAWEYLVRFVFGGVVTAAAGWIGSRYGDAVGGMFLAFPAILPASLTLVKQHGGRGKALEDARGGRAGTLALACFAGVVALGADRWPPALFLPVALGAWIVAALATWKLLLARD